ncbi:hypothetical protein LCGC14_2170180 [marine sediment metagenome]|uniref:Uncharacterized protein n=1 Tax=marine sediment metagenome TaxID=412755 RepID=A0A0F9DQG2_9ZZZZ
MSIEENIAQIRSELDILSQYERMVEGNNFEVNTVADIKGNAKDICDQIKTKADSIKAEIDQWS